MMPFAALLGLPGSTQQAAASTTDVYTYANNEWRGESVTPMAANVQWDVAVKSGNDPKTGRAYTPLVRMLYNEQEIAFRSECTPIADGSTWYKLTELKSCLASDHQTLGDDAHLTDDSTTQPGTGPNTGEGTSTTPNNNGAGTHQPSNTQANGTENELSRTWCCPTAWWPNRAHPMHFMPGTASTPTWWICRPKARAGPSDPIQKQPFGTTKKDIYSKE